MKRMLLASAMLLATIKRAAVAIAMLVAMVTAALAADGIDLTPITDFLIKTAFGVLSAAGAWGIYQVERTLGLRRDSAALDIVRRVMADSLRLGEQRLSELAAGTTFSLGNDRVNAIVDNIVQQAPNEVRRLGYSEEYLAAWARNQLGLGPAPAQAPDGYVGSQGMT